LNAYFKAFFFLTLISTAISCSEQVDESSAEAECAITVDSTSIVDTSVHNDKTWYLVLRISGWHDKTEIVQLFDKKPRLDHCNRDLVAPVIEDSIAHDLSIKSFRIDLKNKEFVIDYIEIPADTGREMDIKLVFL